MRELCNNESKYEESRKTLADEIDDQWTKAGVNTMCGPIKLFSFSPIILQLQICVSYFESS